MEKIVAGLVLTLAFIFIGVPLLGAISMNPLRQQFSNYVDFMVEGWKVVFTMGAILLGFYLLIWSLATLGA